MLRQAPLSDTLRLWLLYQTWFGQLLLLLPVTWWLLSWQHHRIARHADSPDSKKDIPNFIQVGRLLGTLPVWDSKPHLLIHSQQPQYWCSWAHTHATHACDIRLPLCPESAPADL